MDLEYQKDIAKIKRSFPTVRELPDFVVETLWRRFSEDCYCAGFLVIDESYMDQFKNWYFTQGEYRPTWPGLM